MTCRIRFSFDAFVRLLADAARGPATAAVELAQLAGGVEFLVTRPGTRGAITLRLVEGRGRDSFGANPTVQRGELLILVGAGEMAGAAAGWYRNDGLVVPISEITVVGPGLACLGANAPPSASPEEQILWSRTIGALGARAWTRLRSLRFCLLGCGRTGSLVAARLYRLGARSLILVDPDRLEPHNLGEMECVGPESVGRHKVVAVSRALPFAQPVPAGALSLPALAAVKDADIVICAVDNALARLAAGFLAQVYLRPLLDLGTGIFRDREHAGADVRLIWPNGCLLCLGGVASDASGAGDWRQQRAGSLHSLNSLAVDLGLRLLEEFVAGRLRHSTWLRVEFGHDGIPALMTGSATPNSACPLCNASGRGDAGLRLFPSIVEASRAAA